MSTLFPTEDTATLERLHARLADDAARRTSSSSCSRSSIRSLLALVSAFWIAGVAEEKSVASGGKPWARYSGSSTRFPVSGSTMQTMVTTPSSARVRRTCRLSSVAPPTVMLST